MVIYELDINGEVYVSSNEETLKLPINTELVENNIYGYRIFLSKKYFKRFTEEGPKAIDRKEMENILKKSLAERDEEYAN